MRTASQPLERGSGSVIDAFILPGLGVTILAFFIYVGVAWLRHGSDRALSMAQLNAYEEESRND